MSHPTTRREFLKQTLTAGVGLWAVTHGVWAQGKSPNDKLNVGVIGVRGQGGSNLSEIAKTENIVALCDVDEGRLGEAANQFPNAAKYVDFRRMLEERKDIDAVVVSTPDHVHAFASVMAMELGKHVYCEKPLTHSVYEARKMAETARKRKVATQMGNQAHSSSNLRQAVEIVRSGVIGPIRQVHCWSDRPIWPQGIDRPQETPPVPANLHWDLWLGPAPERPYHPIYHPFNWRGWWDFGTGALGDMGCHIMDTAYWALELDAPTSVEAEGEPHHRETGPKWAIVRYEFPARRGMPPVTLIWYDGGRKPPTDLVEGQGLPSNGTIFVGEKGTILFPHADQCIFFPKDKFADFKPPEPSLPRSPGHHQEWIQACKTGSKTWSNFEYAGRLTEAVLLGNAAFRTGHKIYWDSKNLRVTNCAEAEQFVHRRYRAGWSL